MKKFIFEEYHGIHVINLDQTVTCLKKACDFLSRTILKGGKILFVGTKKQAQVVVKETATAAGQHFVTERWLGGTLTNMKTVKQSLKRLQEIESMESAGKMSTYGKKEQSMYRRELFRLHRNLDGIRNMDEFPQALFIVDLIREHNAVAEALRLKIPIVAIVDTNCNPDHALHPIPGNDDSIRSLRMIFSVVSDHLKLARSEWEATQARARAEQKLKEEKIAAAKAAAEAAAEQAAAAKAAASASAVLNTPLAGEPAQPVASNQ